MSGNFRKFHKIVKGVPLMKPTRILKEWYFNVDVFCTNHAFLCIQLYLKFRVLWWNAFYKSTPCKKKFRIFKCSINCTCQPRESYMFFRSGIFWKKVFPKKNLHFFPILLKCAKKSPTRKKAKFYKKVYFIFSSFYTTYNNLIYIYTWLVRICK